MGILETDGVSVAPNAPASGKGRLFYDSLVKSWFNIDDADVLTQLGGGILTVPVVDIDDPSAELNAITGSGSGVFLTAVQIGSSADDELTIYAWDASPAGAESVPFTVDGGGGGQWRAFTGKYTDQALTSSASTNVLRSFYATFASLPTAADVHGLFVHVHGVGDPLLGASMYGVHNAAYKMLKDHNLDDEVVLSPGPTVAIDFGRQTLTYQALTLDQDTALTEVNAVGGTDRWVRVTSGTPGQKLTFPGNWTVFGDYDPSGAGNLIRVVCTSPSVDEIQIAAGGGPAAPPAAYIAFIENAQAAAASVSTGLSDTVAGLMGINGGDPSHLDIKDSFGKIQNLVTPGGPATSVAWTGLTDVTVPTIGLGAGFTHVYIDNAGLPVFESVALTPNKYRTQILLGILLHPGGTVIEDILTVPVLSYGTEGDLVDLYQELGDRVRRGNEYSSAGSNKLANKSAGPVFGRKINILGSPLEPNSLTSGAQVSITPYSYTRGNGAGGFIQNIVETDLDPDFYDDGTPTLAAVPPGKFTAQPFSFDARSGRPVLHYGQTLYDSLDEAQDGINQNDIDFNPVFDLLPLTTWVIAEGGTTNYSDTAKARFVIPLRHSVPPSGAAPPHADTTGQTPNDHHNQVHAADGADHSFPSAGGDTYLDDDGNFTTPPGGGNTLFAWNFSTNVSGADPGTGKFRMNNATPGSVSEIYIDSVTASGLNLDNFLVQLVTGEEIAIQEALDPTKVLLVELSGPPVDNTGWWTIPVTVLSDAGGLFQNNRDCVFLFHAGSAAVAHADTTGQTPNDHHNEAHTIASHSDTTATGAQLDTLVGGGPTGLHSHSVAHSATTGQGENDHHNRQHAIGASADHTASLLAALNALVSDATLDDEGDSRTPDGPAGGDLAGTYPNPTVTDLTIASEARGDILVRGVSGWQRLARGSAGQVVGENGTDVVWVDLPPSADDIILNENWLSGNFDTDEVGSYSWRKLAAGTGNDVAFIATASRQGILDMGLGTVAGGRVAMYLGGITNVNPFKLDGNQNDILAEFLVRFTSIASTDLERATFGFGDSFELAAGLEHANGVYVEFDPSVSAVFRLRTAAASTRSASAGTTTVVVDTWYRVAVRMTYPGGVPTAQLVVNGSDEGSTLTTNIPTVSTGFGQRGDSGAAPVVEARVQINRTRIVQAQLLED